MFVSIKGNVDQAKRALTKIQRKQIPFATSLAINNTAFITRKFIVNTVYPNAFPLARNKRFPSVTFKVKRSTKRRLEGQVYDKTGRGYLANHISGNDKRRFGGAWFAAPIQAKKLASGRMRKKDRTDNPALFEADLKGRGPALWLRDRRGRLKLMYVLRRTIPTEPRFKFYKLGGRRVRTAFPNEFRKALERAIRTAR